ncbi:MAG: ATP-binding protein [Clostridium sp.]|nr:ATP-binding protein [Clostridium sp.]
MGEIFDFALDLLCALLRRCVMIYLLQGMLAVKGRFAQRQKLVAAGYVALSTGYYLLANYFPFWKMFLYGNEEGLQDSRRSILALFFSIGLMLVYCRCFYSGKKSKVCYIVFTIYTLNELTMFTLHSLFVSLLAVVSNILMSLAEKGNEFILQNFFAIYRIYQVLWNISFQIVFLLLFYRAAKILKENLTYSTKELNRVQEVFLAVPSAIGLGICILLRCIMYSYKNMEYKFLMDEYPETRLLIPVISGLCMTSILLSAVILRKLVESGEREMLVEVYQNRIGDMEEHMKDVEHLYDGIRGMRHDMKNHVADLELLLQREKGTSGEYGREMQRYLDGLYLSMEELDMKCSTGNPVTDVVISRKMRQAGERNIPFECNFIFPEGLGISAFDLSILLNNGLDNALEASEKEEVPYIRIDSYLKEKMFFIEIRNGFSGSIITDRAGENLLTGKKDSSLHGLGIKNMKGCAEKYYGTLRWEIKSGEFLIAVMLQGKEK